MVTAGLWIGPRHASNLGINSPGSRNCPRAIERTAVSPRLSDGVCRRFPES